MNGMKQKKFDLKITAFPRMHVTLIGMNSDGYRFNGGIGFSISDPKIVTEYYLSNEIKIIDSRNFGFSTEEQNRLKSKLELIKYEFGLKKSFECLISGQSRTHYGLGSSTAIYLSAIEALFILNQKSYNPELLQNISSRGGTSGIGIQTYFNGGCIFDIGISTSEKHGLKPSSQYDGKGKTPLVISKPILPEWPIGLLIPKNINNKSEDEEVEFFSRMCPISLGETKTILYEVVFGLLASVLEHDYEAFSKHINSIQVTKWKLEERKLYFPDLLELEQQLRHLGAMGVGMSSLGPCLFFTHRSQPEDLAKLRTIEPIFTNTNNKPRIIENA